MFLRRCARLPNRARFTLLVAPTVLILTYFLSRSNSLSYRNLSHVTHHFSTLQGDNTRFWNEAFAVLDHVKPQAGRVRPGKGMLSENWSPDVKHPRLNITRISASDQAGLSHSHAAFVAAIPHLRRLLPYDSGSFGLVTTAGASNFGQAVTMVLAARQSGSTLPIDIILDSAAPWIDALCTGPLRTRFNTSCVSVAQVWSDLDVTTPRLSKFQWKSVATLISRFQNVLWLDVDVLPVLNPDEVLIPGAEPFASTGLVTWPDFWTPSSSSLFYAVAGDVPEMPLGMRSSSESGILIVDKARHGETLLLALYYNLLGPKYYYPLLSQGAPGEGDKETFLNAAVVLRWLWERDPHKNKAESHWSGWEAGGGKRAFWDVKRLPEVHGRTIGDKWRGMFMQQMDPVEDYRVVMSMRKGRKEDAEKGERSKAGAQSSRPTEKKPALNVPLKTLQARIEDLAIQHGSNKFRAIMDQTTHDDHERDITTPPPKHLYSDRYMFFHHNGVKLDFTHLVHDDHPILDRDQNTGRHVRIWGPPDWIVQRTGRDVEKELLQAAAHLYCEETALIHVCKRIRRFYLDVY